MRKLIAAFQGALYSYWSVLIGTLLGVWSMISDQWLQASYWWALPFAAAMLVWAVWREYRIQRFYQQDCVPLPIVINIHNAANCQNALQQMYDQIQTDSRWDKHARNLRHYCHILEQDLIFKYDGDIRDQQALTDFLLIFRYRIEQLKRQTHGKNELYIAYIGPSSVAVLIGATLGNEGARLFQYSKSRDGYQHVASVRGRSIKETPDQLAKIQITPADFAQQQRHSDELSLIIDLASHKINAAHADIVADQADVLHIRSRESTGTLQPDDDWQRYTAEIYHLLNIAMQQGYTHIRLYQSMPVAMALLLGMAAGAYWPLLVTNYQQQQYQPILRMDQLRFPH